MDRRPTTSTISSLTICLLALLLGACASSQDTEVQAVKPTFSTVAIVSVEDVIRVAAKDAGSGESNTEDLLAGAAIGGGVGTAAGAVVASAYCGPYFFGVCLASYALGGALAGAAYGSGWNMFDLDTMKTEELTEDEALKLAQAVSQLDHRQDLNGNLAESLRASVPTGVQRPIAEADMQALPAIEKIGFSKNHDGTVRMIVSASLTFDNGRDDNMRARGKRKFSAFSEGRSIAEWTAGQGELLQKALTRCLIWNADQMAALILEKRTPVDSGHEDAK